MRHAAAFAITLLACAGLGCSSPGPLTPQVAAKSETLSRHVVAGPQGGSLALIDPAARIARPGPAGQSGPRWRTVASTTVGALGGVVAGSRYQVTVLPLSLTEATTISIREYSPDIIDFELLPDGTQFLVPVTVEIDYAGTILDPAHPDYEGELPVLLWLDPPTGLWELIPGVDNPLTKKYTVLLGHFSRYKLGQQPGTAEW